VIVLVDNLLDQTVIDQDLRRRVRFPLYPDLHLPPVPVEVGTFSLVSEQTVAGINLHLFIDPDFHCSTVRFWRI
jgi:hypothetical protein